MRPNLQPTAVSVAAGYLRHAEEEVIAAQAAAKLAAEPCTVQGGDPTIDWIDVQRAAERRVMIAIERRDECATALDAIKALPKGPLP